MPDISLPPLRNKIRIHPALCRYPALGLAYRQKGYEIQYADRLVHLPDQDFYVVSRFLEGLGDGRRMSTAAEELAIQLQLERAGQDPRTAPAFDDLFGRNDDGRYFWQWTATGLRVPEGRDPTVYEKDEKGRKYWVRILVIGNTEIGEVLVPEGNGRVVPHTPDVRDVWDEATGLPTITEPIKWPHAPCTTHFWFDPNFKEAAVGRGSREHSQAGSCLDVLADCPRLGAAEYAGIRLVLGPYLEINVKKTIGRRVPALDSIREWLGRRG